MSKIDRVILIVLDSLGCGFLPDAANYGDLGANTISHIAYANNGINIPNLEKLGIGNLTDILAVNKIDNTEGAYCKAKEKSKGKDTTVGHWEIAGIISDKALPTFPDGFPKNIINKFEKKINRKILGNKVSSGIKIIEEFGEEHMKTGYPIIYTSADSVFQIAAHEDIINIKDLYIMCEEARAMLDVGRVIARPFVGEIGSFKRTSNRHDFSLIPKDNIIDKIKNEGLDTISVGKIYDIFGEKGFTNFVRTNGNEDGINKTIEYIKKENKGLIFSNLVDFDMNYGHRRDPVGYKNALEYFDMRLPEIYQSMKKNDMLIITADHGCDPIFKGTDHTREYIPILIKGENIKSINLGIRDSFTDIASSIDEALFSNSSLGSFFKEIIK